MMQSKQGVFNFLRAYYHFKSYDYKKIFHKNLKMLLLKLSKMPEYYIMKNHLGMSQTVNKYMPNKLQIKNCYWLTNKDLKFILIVLKLILFKGL